MLAILLGVNGQVLDLDLLHELLHALHPFVLVPASFLEAYGRRSTWHETSRRGPGAALESLRASGLGLPCALEHLEATRRRALLAVALPTGAG